MNGIASLNNVNINDLKLKLRTDETKLNLGWLLYSNQIKILKK